MSTWFRFGTIVAIVYTIIAAIIYNRDVALDKTLMQYSQDADSDRLIIQSDQTLLALTQKELDQVPRLNARVAAVGAEPIYSPEKIADLQKEVEDRQKEIFSYTELLKEHQARIHGTPSAEDFTSNATLFGFCAAGAYIAFLIVLPMMRPRIMRHG